MDDGPPTTHAVELLRVEARHKGPDVLHMTSWRDGEERILISRRPRSMPHVHLGVAPGTPLRVETKPGAFGWEWIVGIAPDR